MKKKYLAVRFRKIVFRRIACFCLCSGFHLCPFLFLISKARADLATDAWSLTPEVVTVADYSKQKLNHVRPGLLFSLKESLIGSEQWTLSLESKLRTDFQKKFSSTEKDYEFRMDRAFVQRQGQRTSVALGLQKYTWGDSAFFDGVDFLNPRDLTEPLYEDDERTKIAVPSLNLQYLGDNTIFQTVLILKTMRTPLEKQFAGVLLEMPQERPWLRELEWGIKAGGLLKSGWDINGYLLSHYERLPQFFLIPDPKASIPPAVVPGVAPGSTAGVLVPPVILSVNEPRVFSFGLTVTQSGEELVFRSELALHSNRALPEQGALRSFTADQAVLHSTFDLTTFKDLLTTFEIWGEQWMADSSTKFKNQSVLVGFRSQKPLWDGRFEPSMGYLQSPQSDESWAFFKVQCKPFGAAQISVEAHRTQTSTGSILARRGLKNLLRSSVSYQF